MTTSTETQTVNIERTVKVEFSPDEYLTVVGDRKPSGGNRVGRIICVLIEYRWIEGEWAESGYYSVSGWKEQQKADGSWSEPTFDRWVTLSRETKKELIKRFRPTAAIELSVTE